MTYRIWKWFIGGLMVVGLLNTASLVFASTYTRTPSGSTPTSPITLDLTAPAYSGVAYVAFQLYDQGTTVLFQTTCTLSDGIDYNVTDSYSVGTAVYGVVLKYWTNSSCAGSALDWNADLEGTSNMSLNSTDFSGSTLQFTVTSGGGGGGGGSTSTLDGFGLWGAIATSSEALIVNSGVTFWELAFGVLIAFTLFLLFIFGLSKPLKRLLK